MIVNIFEIPEILLNKGLPFAIYRLPDSSSFTLIFQKNNLLQEIDILSIEDYSGFIVANYESAKTGIATLIKPDYIYTEKSNFKEVHTLLSKLPDDINSEFVENFVASKSSYLEKATYLINKLMEGDLNKVVLSRVIHKKLNKSLNIPSLLKMMAANYKDAFINLFHLPGVGTWFGASPETLFKVEGKYITTDSLAGTKPVASNSEPKWTNKEKEEQHMVTSFIESLLSELGIVDFKQNGPITKNAGTVAHLLTKFRIPYSALVEKQGKLIAGLHPTPAICGLPKAEAYLLIQKAEQHERRYYTGFLGPWKISDNNSNKSKSELFVNLRCAELGNKEINIYVGGGLTASSDPEEEYLETVHKSNTLLSIVENL